MQWTPTSPGEARIHNKAIAFLFGRQPLSHYDILIAIGLVCLTLWFGLRYYEFDLPPEEDAAILLRYAENLANGHGMVWNIGEAPVDGATDFLFTVVLAGLITIGFAASTAVEIVGFAAHLATVGLVYFSPRKLWTCNRAVAIISATLIITGPGVAYIAAHFGTPLFAFFATLTWYFALQYMQDLRHRSAALFALSGLMAGLTRPEGGLITGFMLVALVYYCGPRKSLKAVYWVAFFFLILGGAYFVWRWAYFGYPLPNPFYKKGGGSLFVDHLVIARNVMLRWTFPFNLAVLVGFRSRQIARLTVSVLIPLVGFVGMWVLLSSEMNYVNRFQYAGLPLFAISWPAFINGLWKNWNLSVNRQQRRINTLLLIIVILGSIYFIRSRRIETRHEDGRIDVAVLLRDFQEKGYTIATTEAGLLPYYSGWNSIDTWGLNDQWIAHNGGITYEYLDRFRPEIIMLHAYYSPGTLAVNPDKRGKPRPGWNEMLDVLHRYAEDQDYILAAVFGSEPVNTHYYYVRSDFPESMELVTRIQQIDYTWYLDGQTALNFAPAE